ncbi:MAG: hypothetical protein HDS22_06240 [Bacteroides sp.]|nr:hypothetical protein [Bacteroides sp.]
MKKLLLLFTAVLTWAAASAQTIQQYKVEVGQFAKIKVTDNVNVVYRCLPDSSGWVQYVGAKEFANAFVITPKEGQLKIQVSTEDVGHPELPTLYVYSDFLTSVENSSSATLTVENPAPCAEFSAKEIGNGRIVVEGLKANVVKASIATGNGTVNLSGTCKDAIFQMVGTGVIAADRLKADQVQCKILGGGTIGCWAVDKLNAKGIGSTKIYYKGEPLIKKSGGGSLYPLPEDRPLDTVVPAE